MAVLRLIPAVLDVESYQGDTVAVPISILENGVAPATLAGRIYNARIARFPGSDEFVVPTVTVVSNTVAPQLLIGIDDEVHDDMFGEYVWDFQQTVSGEPRTLFKGKWVVHPEVHP